MFKKIFLFLLLSLTLFSCKVKQKEVAPIANNNLEATTVSNIIKNHESINRNFKTVFIKANVDYSSAKQNLSLVADIRIKKNEIILISIKILGITMAKALITPEKVQYYEKINGKYFEGDYKILSNWLGTDLDFQKVQNILLGQAIDNLSKSEYVLTMEDNNPKLSEVTVQNTSKYYIFDLSTFGLKKQEIYQKSPERQITVNYANYKLYPESTIPGELLIFAKQNNEITTIEIQYKNATFNEELTFPYSVPGGFESITIN
jgi:hypothetical protein